MTKEQEAQVKQFCQERNEALLSMDEKRIRDFVTKWNGTKMPSHPEAFWGGVHKCITGMKTPYLLRVPKTAKSKRKRIADFKKTSRIWTIHSGHMRKDDNPWTAVLLPEGMEEKSSAAWDYVINHPDLITGRTEEEAIRELCKENNIEFLF